MTDSLRTRVLNSLAWTGLGHGVRQGLTLVVGIILARVLSPSDFGVLAMVLVLTGFTEMFLDLGLGSALVQRPEIDESHLSTTFWTTLLTGAVLAGGWILAAPLVARFYSNAFLGPLTMLLALNLLVSALKVVPMALLTRAMCFRRLAVIETIAVVLAGSTAVTMACQGFGVWSLVAQVLILNAATTLLLWVTGAWRPRLLFRPRALRQVIGFSGYLVSYQMTDYWSMRIDQLLLGRLFGASVLGLYAKAYELMMLPLRQVGMIVSRVMFPAFSSIQDDQPRLRRIYLRSLGCIGLVSFPLMLGMGAAAPSLIPAVLGAQWVGIVPILQIFCLVGVAHAIGPTTGWIFLSQGRTDLMFRWGLLAATVKTIAIVIGLRWGAVGVAASYTIACYAILLYPAFAIPGRLIGLSFLDVLLAVRAPFVCAAIMAGLVVAVGMIPTPHASPWVRLALQIPVGVLSYWTLIHLLNLEPYRQFSRIVSDRWVRMGRRRTRMA